MFRSYEISLKIKLNFNKYTAHIQTFFIIRFLTNDIIRQDGHHKSKEICIKVITKNTKSAAASGWRIKTSIHGSYGARNKDAREFYPKA